MLEIRNCSKGEKNTEKCNDQRIIMDFIFSPKINSPYDLKIVLSRFIAIPNAKR
jgi:hypothetical protein